MTKPLTKAGLAECVRHLEAARDHRSKMAAHTRDREVRLCLLAGCSALTTAIDHIRVEWGLK
jgi:hypothetical protein